MYSVRLQIMPSLVITYPMDLGEVAAKLRVWDYKSNPPSKFIIKHWINGSTGFIIQSHPQIWKSNRPLKKWSSDVSAQQWK